MIWVQPDDPQQLDVVESLTAHLAFSNEHSAPEDVHALDVDSLCSPDIDFFSARSDDGELLGVGALRRLSPDHCEIKSMHTTAAARGQGIGRTMVEHLLAAAHIAGATRVSLETGTMEAFAPARALYTSLGFVVCEPFGDYWATAASVCMTLELGPA